MNRDLGAPAISLIFRHPSADLSFIPGDLGMSPSALWMVGDQRRTPKGREIEGKRLDSYCAISLPNSENIFFFEEIVKFHAENRTKLICIRNLLGDLLLLKYYATIDRDCVVAGMMRFDAMVMLGGDGASVEFEVLL